MDLFVLLWFASAVRLCPGKVAGKRVAWVVSLLGVGALLSLCLGSVVTILTMDHTAAINRAGFIVFSLGMVSIPFLLSLKVFIGLLKMRKELRSIRNETGANPPQCPTPTTAPPRINPRD